MVVVAFCIRAGTFSLIIQPYKRYQQPDSLDYHCCALSLAAGYGMHRIDTKRPIFWRTPGYPLFLVPFYKFFGLSTVHFSDYEKAQRAALWVQILLCSLLPLLVLWFSLLMTESAVVSYVAAWISTFHPGFVLASTYLLTDALASLLFLLSLIFFCKSFMSKKQPWLYCLLSALCLGAVTWMRPMGQLIGLLYLLIMPFAYASLKKKLIMIGIFAFIFFGLLSPWYIRNYRLCGALFFCPLWGPYAKTFIAPKIMRRLTGDSLEQCMNYFSQVCQNQIKNRYKQLADSFDYVICNELECSKVVTPYILAHSFYAALEWLKEITKTAFDLYTSQLVSFANNTFSWDPPEEFLLDKFADCLYKQSMLITMRLCCWLELLYALLLWLGLFLAASLAVYSLFFQRFFGLKWCLLVVLSCGIIGMTGGFGYARLRLPVEALLIVIALHAWQKMYHLLSN